jgi:hypothetical protein
VPARKPFSIREDLESRPLDTQVEIMWISGPNAFTSAAVIAARLQVPEDEVAAALARLVGLPGRRYDYFRQFAKENN